MNRWLKGTLIGVGGLVIVGVSAVMIIRRPAFHRYDEASVSQFIAADFIELDKVFSISKFRSGAGHDYSSGTGETCRSMKHYFSPQPTDGKDVSAWYAEPDPATATTIFSPVDGRISAIESEHTPVGKQIHIRPAAAPDFTVRLFHVFPLDSIKVGVRVQAGQQIGRIHQDQGTDIAVEVGGLFGTQDFSYFAVMPDHLFAAYQARGVISRADLIISKEARDAHPLQCAGEQFRQAQDEVADYVHLSGYQAPQSSGQSERGQSSFSSQTPASTSASSSPVTTHSSESVPPLLLQSIGFNLDTYDPATNRAGDLQFTKLKLQFDRLWMDFGFVIPGAQSSTQADKSNPQPTFIVPLGTKVRSLVDGVVVDIKTLSSGDWTVMVAKDAQSPWIYETEHVANPVVKVGDRVKAGQVVAEAANFNNNAPEGFGVFEIGILHGGNPPEHICPFAYLDPAVKEDLHTKIRSLYAAWEEYTGKPNLYDEANLPLPGCLTLDGIPG